MTEEREKMRKSNSNQRRNAYRRQISNRTSATRRASASRASVSRRSIGSSTLNILLLIISAVVGLISWIIGNIVYEICLNNISRVIIIGVIFAILSLILMIVVHAISNISGAYEEPILPLPDSPGIIFILIALGTAAMLVLSALFQWIYALDLKKQVVDPTSYIFVIDDSGSTTDSDPNQMRYSAIDEVLRDMDESFPYMVYRFSDSYEVIRDMAPISAVKNELTGNSSGGTAIRGVLTQVIDDYENHVWDGGERPKVIIMTDGYATDIGLFRPINKVLKRYVKENISISAVGLDEVDEDLMNKIAETTGGVFVRASDASLLSSAMKSAVTQTSSRDLVSTRYAGNMNVLLGFLRILFIFILGTGIGFLVLFVYGNDDSTMLIIVSSVIKSAVGALIMELGTGVFGIPGKLSWFILWILLSATIALKPSGSERGRGTSRYSSAEILRY